MPDENIIPIDQRCMVDCHHCGGKGKVKCECESLVLVPNHPMNVTDYSGPHGGQGYSVKKCRKCGRIWGIRWQWDSGTGGDDHYKDFGFGDPFELVKERHY